MTIQNQIPKIIVTLLLLTFSYAIAGFLIDLMYLSIYLLINIFAQNDLATITNISGNPITGVGYLTGGFQDIAGPPASSVGGIVASMFDGNIGKVISTAVTAIIGTMIGGNISIAGFSLGPVGALAGGAAGFLFGSSIIKYIAMIIVYLIIVIAVLNALFRVWFMLIKAYIFILLGVIFAPFWIVLGLFPTGSGGFGPWLRSLIANLAAFPAVILLFMVGKSIQENIQPTGGNFLPPFVGDLGADSVSAMGSVIGLGIILIMPEALNVTKSTLKAPDFKLAAAAGRAIGVGQSVISKPIGGIQHELFGKDPMGNPKAGSAWLGRNGGRFMQMLSGGSIKNKDEHGNKTSLPLFKMPGSLRGKTLEENPIKRAMRFGTKEKNWKGQTTPEGKEYQDMKRTSDNIRDQIKKNEAKPSDFDEIKKYGQTFYRPKTSTTTPPTDTAEPNQSTVEGTEQSAQGEQGAGENIQEAVRQGTREGMNDARNEENGQTLSGIARGMASETFTGANSPSKPTDDELRRRAETENVGKSLEEIEEAFRKLKEERDAENS